MLKRRLLPVLFLKDGWMVRSEAFSEHQYIGDPVSHVQRMNQWNVDELLVIDISQKENSFVNNRDDYRSKPANTLSDFINMIAVECRIPLTFGGKIRSESDVELRIQSGADKIMVNKLLHANHEIVTKCARRFGSQAIVGSVDYRIVDGNRLVFTDFGLNNSRISLVDFTKRAVDHGVGELFINCIDFDGKATGYDLIGIERIASTVEVPVIACGGAGHQSHFARVLSDTKASAVAAGNLFHFKENAYPLAKNYLKKHFTDIR